MDSYYFFPRMSPAITTRRMSFNTKDFLNTSSQDRLVMTSTTWDNTAVYMITLWRAEPS